MHPVIGQVWQLCENGRLYKVVQHNDSRESPGSFVMHAVEGKGVKYLHLNALMKGEWACVEDIVRMSVWHRLLSEDTLPI